MADTKTDIQTFVLQYRNGIDLCGEYSDSGKSLMSVDLRKSTFCRYPLAMSAHNHKQKPARTGLRSDCIGSKQAINRRQICDQLMQVILIIGFLSLLFFQMLKILSFIASRVLQNESSKSIREETEGL